MSEFAQVDQSGLVLQVIVAEQDFINSGLAGPASEWLPVVPEGSAGIGYSWDAASSAFWPPGGFPRPTGAEAKAQLLAAIATVEAVALGGYSVGERQSWPTQLAEAAAFLGLSQAQLLAGEPGTPGADLSLAPFLAGTCTAEYGPASEEVRLAQVNQLAPAVAANAKALSDLSQALIGIRRSAFAAIDSAEDAAGRQAALDAALASLAGMAG